MCNIGLQTPPISMRQVPYGCLEEHVTPRRVRCGLASGNAKEMVKINKNHKSSIPNSLTLSSRVVTCSCESASLIKPFVFIADMSNPYSWGLRASKGVCGESG